MASPTLNLSVIKPDPNASELLGVSSSLRNDIAGNSENSTFRNPASSYSQQINNDTTSPPPSTDIPQWKKDLIQRRKTNIAKTIAANQIGSIAAHSSQGIANATTTTTLGALSPNSESRNQLIFAKNNNCDKLISALNANTSHDTEINTSQHSFATGFNDNMCKTPATLQSQQQQQQHGKIETSCGGHYTQVNNKSSGGSHNYTEKLAARTASVIQQEQQPPVPASRLFGMEAHQNISNDGNPTLGQENARFRKNLTEQHETQTTNTTNSVSDSLITSTSRLSSSLKVAAAAEIYKKSNKDHLTVSVGEQPHTLQEPALAMNVSSSGSNNNNSNVGSGANEQQLHHHQLKSEHESDNLVVCASVNLLSTKEEDSKLYQINNNANGTVTLSPKVALNKKPCGIATASVRSSAAPPQLSTSSSSSSSQFVKNQNIGNSTLVSSHHNYKINTKYRLNQNSTSSLPVSATASAIESSTTTTVTNNKKKMVAVQEMNEISKNELDFDPSEELQYGPGIVSKLRCRYLSLALRQSMGKQRLSLDTLRRATSLNNLLDDNDVHDEDEDEDDAGDGENRKHEPTSPTSAAEPPQVKQNANDEVVELRNNVKNRPYERSAGATLSYSNQNRSRHIKRGNDSLKRARSVEALLCEKSPWNFSNNHATTLSNGGTDSVTIEDKINNARDRLLMGTDNPPKRLTSIIDDTERPPPDLVKQTLKIFEASANRRSRVLNRNSGGEVATKVANYKSIITQNKPAITFPKPPVSPKKSNLKKTTPTEVKPISTPSTTAATQSTQADKNLVPLSSTPAASSRTTTAFSQKLDLTPIRNVGCVSNVEGLSENSPDIIPRHKLLDKTLPTNNGVDSPVTEITKKIEKLRIESPAVIQTQSQQPPRKELQNRFTTESSDEVDSDEDDDEDDSLDGEYVVNSEDFGPTKLVSKSTLENIAKAGTSQQFQFSNKSISNGNTNAKYSEPHHDIPTLPTAGTTTVKQIGVIRPLLAEPQYTESSSIGFIEENPTVQTSSTLTSREIEKNRINNEKKIEKSGSNSSMDELGGSAGFSKIKQNIVTTASTSEGDDNTQAPVWSSAIINKKKRNPVGGAPENNTMVFNFKDRKEVPDYIENDGLIFKRKRELPKPNESGFVLLGDLSLETSTDPEDDWPMCPPSPCDVEFENANVIIDGKSSIKNRTKEAHFRVQFNDTLTSTFEYPSESSVIEISGSDYADLSSDVFDASTSMSMNLPPNEPDTPIVHHHVAVDEIIPIPHNNKALGNLSLGSAPLGNYTPVKAKIENIFQLGVTRLPNSQTDSPGDGAQPKEIPPVDYYGEHPSLEYLKPASDDLTIAYSEGSLKTDLLY